MEPDSYPNPYFRTMKLVSGLFIAVCFVSCLSEDAEQELTAVDSPVTEEHSIDTFVVGKGNGIAVNETPEGESLRLENDSAIENIRLAINGNQNSEEDMSGVAAIVKNPDVGPSFPGGSTAMDAYIAKHLEYPMVAFQNDITGIVNVRFVIETDGKITGIVVQKGLGFGCDEAAIDFVSGMPKWTPGRKGGVNVRCSVVLPLSFQKPVE